MTTEDINTKSIQEVISLLYGAFRWNTSPQDAGYWSEVVWNLRAIEEELSDDD